VRGSPYIVGTERGGPYMERFDGCHDWSMWWRKRRKPVPAVAHLTRDGKGGEVPQWTFPKEFEVQTDLAPARWIEESLPKYPWASLGSMMPDGFEAYARILHPAHRNRGEGPPVTWAEIAAEHGKTMHPSVQFHLIAELDDPDNDSPQGMVRPSEGELPNELVEPLIEVLGPATRTAERCWFAPWIGDGMFSILEGIEDYPLIKVPGREYLLLAGRLEALRSYQGLDIMGPNIWWPDDGAWCVATEVDLLSTFVGGTQACIDALLVHPSLEAYPAEFPGRVDGGADTINA
jgi:hypothetical protein